MTWGIGWNILSIFLIWFLVVPYLATGLVQKLPVKSRTFCCDDRIIDLFPVHSSLYDSALIVIRFVGELRVFYPLPNSIQMRRLNSHIFEPAL